MEPSKPSNAFGAVAAVSAFSIVLLLGPTVSIPKSDWRECYSESKTKVQDRADNMTGTGKEYLGKHPETIVVVIASIQLAVCMSWAICSCCLNSASKLVGWCISGKSKWGLVCSIIIINFGLSVYFAAAAHENNKLSEMCQSIAARLSPWLFVNITTISLATITVVAWTCQKRFSRPHTDFTLLGADLIP